VTGYQYPTAYTSWGTEEKDAMERVIRSERFTMGAEVEAAEAELAAYHGRKHCIMVNSGSSANLVAVAALHLVQNLGYNIIVPALAWPTTYSPFVQYGRNFDVQDSDETWNLSYKGLIARKDDEFLDLISAVVVVNILGIPGYIGGIKKWCVENDKILIEDNCESFGARYDDKLCGTFGLVSTLSFYHSHQLSAIEGGAILTDVDDIARACRMLRNHGWTKGVDKPKKFQDEYKFVMHGYNVRPLELHAAILREQLKKAEEMARVRRDNYFRFRKVAAEFGLGLPAVADPKGINPFNFSFLCENVEQRDYLVGKLRQNSIDCRPVVGGSYACQPYYSNVDDQHDTPKADEIHYRGISIGIPLNPNTGLEYTLLRIFKETL
jgi:CDP-6-deoxy-D-xylo-4-hexulose-3-dehydrase